MAISSTINKVSLNIADVDRHYYQLHELTVAQHPSENDFRFMIRLIAFMVTSNNSKTSLVLIFYEQITAQSVIIKR